MPVQPKASGYRPVFVLGAYSSAVHAFWRYGPGRNAHVAALAIGNEPEPFWDGLDQADRISQFQAPFGSLQPTPLNGVSGQILNKLYLKPLGLMRSQCWITDLHPTYYANEKQKAAFERAFHASRSEVQAWSLPMRPTRIQATVERVVELRQEFEQCRPERVITLGNEAAQALGMPTLSRDGYGLLRQVEIWGRTVEVLTLTHPRNAGKLGWHSSAWAETHERWIGVLQSPRNGSARDFQA